MIEGREVIAYTLYVAGFGALVVEQVLNWKMMRALRAKYPGLKGWLWQRSATKEFRKDPVWRQYQWRSFGISLVAVACILGGSALLGSRGPTWLEWLPF